MTKPDLRQRLLVLLLRIGAVMTLLAFPTMLLPVDWMADIHEWLGLGDLPRGPIVDYLARSIAALYGFHGVLLLIVSFDVARYRPIVVYLGVMNLVFGGMILVIDLMAGMPAMWTMGEGPPLLVVGALIFYLLRSVPRVSG